MNRQSDSSRFLRSIFKLGLAICILAAGTGLAYYFDATKPVVEKKMPQPQTVFVEAIQAQKGPAQAMVSGMGTVVPSQQITLRARVSGTLIALSERFVPGGRIPQGEEILRLDPSDYEIEVAKSESELQKALADLEMEQGRQAVARQELELLQESSPGDYTGTDLALRKPQLHQAEAQVAIARSELARARLNMNRTVLTAPFNALVVNRQVDFGAQVGTQDPLATLAATDEYWIEASVPVDRIGDLDLESESGSVEIFSQTGSGQWSGRIMHSLGILDENSRLAKVLISVRNPLDAGSNPLMLGDYVRVAIQGRDLGEMFVLPRKALRRGDAVWIAAEGRLEIRPVEIALRSGETVYVRSGLNPGELIILSNIAAPVPGMPLDVAESSGPQPDVAQGGKELSSRLEQ